MAAELRQTGIRLVGDVPWGTHFCHFYETKEDLLDILVPYFKAGLENNESCVWVVSDPLTEEEVREALRRAVPRFDQHLAERSLEILMAGEWYLERGVFDLQRVTTGWNAKLGEALARGYDGLRVSGNTAWLEKKDWADFRDYEKQINESISGQPMSVLCTYPLVASGAAEILDVARNHQFAIAKRRGQWDVVETPQLKQAKAEIARLNEVLEQRVIERTIELRTANEVLRNEIIEHERTEEALRESEERFRQMAENIREVFWVSSTDFRDPLYSVLYVSPAYESVWGRSCETLYQNPRSFIDAIHPEDRARAVAVIERERERGFEVEYRVVRPDGSIRRIRARGFPVRDESGRFYRVAGIAEDITERKQAEALLHAREQEFRAIVENAPDQIIRYDREFRRTYVNPAVARAYGLPAAALIGTPIGSVIQAAGLDVKEEEVAPIRRRIGRVFDTGEPSEYEISWPIPMGRRHYSVRLSPEFDLNGSVINVLAISRDITQRKQDEEKLRRSESQLAEAQRVAHVGYWERDIDTGEITWSDETYRIFGVQPQEPIKSFLQLIHPEDRAVQVEATAQLLRGEPYDVEYRVIRPDGEVRLVHSQGQAVLDESGRPRRAFGTVQDVTQLKRADEKLKATTEQLRALSARLQSTREEEGIRIAREIHDELGSALTSLRWDLEGIAKTFSQHGTRSQLPDLRKKIAAMLGLTDTTIDIVKRVASELRPSVFDVAGLMEAIDWQARQFQKRTGIVVHYDTSLEHADLNQEQSTAVFRIFQEALTNVLRHAQATRVDLTVVEEAGSFVLTIRDNGRGITEEEKSGQLSIGLLGMRERAHVSGGEIDIAGVEGEGTTVTVRLPIARAGRHSKAAPD